MFLLADEVEAPARAGRRLLTAFYLSAVLAAARD